MVVWMLLAPFPPSQRLRVNRLQYQPHVPSQWRVQILLVTLITVLGAVGLDPDSAVVVITVSGLLAGAVVACPLGPATASSISAA